ncbi:alkaline phosphatase D family protein [Amycolatopsis nigrescens]|uniref:alkaline phosphatase D family protein n=1 Tax=Amycolatopsis nigrescens TaxID=381445 RepID=UPI000363070E|nr:alkaline phosphatase D family protein [Amycolatopsis nigrescens]
MPGFGSPSRRSVLLGGAGALALATGSAGVARASAAQGAGLARPLGDLFTLGVASGDPYPTSVVLWTRLAADPVAEDGLGGMPGRRIPVQWQISKNEQFTRIVRSGEALTTPESAHSVHVEAQGLEPGTEYFYRFRTGGAVSRTGRTRTAPAPGRMGELTMCFASCSHFGEGYFTAYRRMAEDQPGLILHLGDYQYEYAAKATDVRTVLGPETVALADYRLRHSQYKTDPDLQLAHATAPWLVVWDDHETENNWADEIPEASSQTPGAAFLDRRRAAFQAYYENMPLRRTSRPKGIDMQLYRRIGWGGLINFHMLDTRQYRDDQLFGDGNKPDAPELRDPRRTITGAEQEAWLLDGLRRSGARWDVLGQQVWFSQMDHDPGPAKILSMDSWDGYQASKDRVRDGFRHTRNTVVLTGDVHSHWANEVKADFNDPGSPSVATELVTTSVTSGRDGADTTPGGDKLKAANSHIKFYSYRRGYVRTRIDAGQVRADFRTLPYVSKPDAPAQTAASFVVEDRDPTLHTP